MTATTLDYGLLHEAELLCTGANGHRIRQAIQKYVLRVYANLDSADVAGELREAIAAERAARRIG